MKFLVDLNLSPQWVDELNRHGIEATHWALVGDLRAPDSVIMQWAAANGLPCSRTIVTSARCWQLPDRYLPR